MSVKKLFLFCCLAAGTYPQLQYFTCQYLTNINYNFIKQIDSRKINSALIKKLKEIKTLSFPLGKNISFSQILVH